jgi:tRNA dimethylallyltransferase
LEDLARQKGYQWLHAKLAILDPPAANSIDPRNVRRSIRALEVVLTTGKRFSDQRSQASSPYRIIMVGLTRPRPELYARIDARLSAMFTAGFLEEVQHLLDKGYAPNLPSMSAIGYRECCEVISGCLEIEQVRPRIQHATRVFVRRQSNWFKMDDPAIRWFDAGRTPVAEIEAYLRAAINSDGS